MSPRVTAAFWLMVGALVLILGLRSSDTPEGWSWWWLVPAALMNVLSGWLLRVESRDPWGQ